MTQLPMLGDNRYPLSPSLQATLIDPQLLRPLGRETRPHSQSHIRKLARSIDQLGFRRPVLIDKQGRVICGWALVRAAIHLKLGQVPAITVTDLKEHELRALRLAMNNLGEESPWVAAELALEFKEILALDGNFDIQLSGFEMGEIDRLTLGTKLDEEDEFLPEVPSRAPITKPGDLWVLGSHRVFCGDARTQTNFEALLSGETAQMVFTDPPYNVRIEGNVSGLGGIKHGEFAMASGEMSDAEFANFLRSVLRQAIRCSADGAIHFVCINWRGLRLTLEVTDDLYTELKNICVWNKTNAGMGSLYRSKHEFILVLKVGQGPHINNVTLGTHGRNRTNVWDYAGQTSLKGAKNKLALHPTVKPVALVADAIRDCSDRNGIILDPFGGSGTTCIAAERTGRRARLIEIDPAYVDTTVLRWQHLTGETAMHAATGEPFGKP